MLILLCLLGRELLLEVADINEKENIRNVNALLLEKLPISPGFFHSIQDRHHRGKKSHRHEALLGLCSSMRARVPRQVPQGGEE
jgi:hypothetical protein